MRIVTDSHLFLINQLSFCLIFYFKTHFILIILINPNPQIQTIVEQMYFGSILNENSITNSKHLAFISIDDGIMTCIGSYIVMKNNETISHDFNIWLDIIEKDNKITIDEKNDIKKYHKKRENILNQNEILMMEINKKYIVLLKILLAYLFGYRQSKSDWEKRTKEYKQKLKL